MADAPAVSIRIPGLLARFTDGDRSVTVRAETVSGGIEALLARYPALEPHLHDDDGDLRPHLSLFLNGAAVPEAVADETGLETDDEIVVLQAVSGG